MTERDTGRDTSILCKYLVEQNLLNGRMLINAMMRF